MTWQDLDFIRKAKGLSMSELSRMAGRDRKAFSHAIAMRGHTRRTESLWRAFCAVLGVDAPFPRPSLHDQVAAARLAAMARERKARELALELDVPRARGEIPAPPRSTFVRGKRYEIRGSMRGSREADASWMSHTVVTYLRKEGSHHVFRGPGGWLTTWTDAQLVGKRVTSA